MSYLLLLNSYASELCGHIGQSSLHDAGQHDDYVLPIRDRRFCLGLFLMIRDKSIKLRFNLKWIWLIGKGLVQIHHVSLTPGSPGFIN